MLLLRWEGIDCRSFKVARRKFTPHDKEIQGEMYKQRIWVQLTMLNLWSCGDSSKKLLSADCRLYSQKNCRSSMNLRWNDDRIRFK